MKGLLVATLAIVAIACSTTSGPQLPEVEPADWDAYLDKINAIGRRIDERTQQQREKGNLLGEVQVLRALAAEYEEDELFVNQYIGSYLAEKLTFIGNYTEAHRYFVYGKPRPMEREPEPTTLEGFTARRALHALGRVCEPVQAVFINESHHVPQHRAFTLQLLRILRDQGFTYFAAETLEESDTMLQERGYPIRESGWYTQEPVYGDLIRTALGLGYRVVAYEAAVGDPNEREPGQARNLVQRIIEEDSAARLVVHVGWEHNSESPQSFNGAGAMAFHFKVMTGIDPLTIDQTLMTESIDPAYEHPFYRYLNDRELISEPVVLEHANGDLWHLPGDGRDVTLFHPRSHYENGRPTWLKLGGSRDAVPLPHDVCGSTRRCLVEAQKAEEGSDAIPVDRVEVTADEAVPALMLPDGNFSIKVVDAKGTTINSFILHTGDRN